MNNEVYLSWLITSTISLFLILIMICRIVFNQSLRNKIFHQLMICLVLGDLFISCSWYLGNKTNNLYTICLIQEYLLQFGLLIRAFITVILCYLSNIIVVSLILPSYRYIIKIIILCFLFISIILIVSIFFQTGDIFCLNDDINRKYELRYNVIVLGPIYTCFLFNIILYFITRSKVYQHHQTSSQPTNIGNLLNISTQLLRYPVVYAILLLPDLLYGFYVYITGEKNLYFSVIASSSSGITGAIFALRYMFRHDPTLLAIAPLLLNHQTQNILNFAVNFTSINFSFRRKRRNDNHDETSNQESNSAPLRGRNQYDSSVSNITRGTDASLMTTTPVNRVLSGNFSEYQESRANTVDTQESARMSGRLLRKPTETLQETDDSASRGFWGFFSSNAPPYEFTHSRSVSTGGGDAIRIEYSIDSTTDFL